MTCNYCGSTKKKTIVYGKPYAVVTCLGCGLSFLSPQPTKKELTKLYNSQYFNNSDGGPGYTNYVGLARDLELEAKRRLSYIQKYSKTGTVLDAGCGFGTFLIRAKQMGYTVTGCDISLDAANELRKNHIRVITADIASKQFPKGCYDIITAWDVIEHVTNPMQTFKAFCNSLRRGGYLFMTTPNMESIDAKLLGTKWYGFKKIPEHLYYFTPATIGAYLQKTGYELIDIRAWGFQRNLAYCVGQVARYNIHLQRLLHPVSKTLGLKNISFFFPFIDMFIAARKP
jgi:SAM-dependent methyltransferase